LGGQAENGKQGVLVVEERSRSIVPKITPQYAVPPKLNGYFAIRSAPSFSFLKEISGIFTEPRPGCRDRRAKGFGTADERR
jgi:hypothetical protein